MVDLGFVTREANGKVNIPEEQLYMIINFDKSCLSLDGTKGRRGGKPEITLHDPCLPYNGGYLTASLVCGRNAAGEALHPHFQFKTKATSEDTECLRNKVFAYCPQVLGRFGYA